MRAVIKKNKVIALDADGVLLDYSSAYARAWLRAFGVQPELRNAQAYWPIDRWAVARLEGEALQSFRAVMDEKFWSTMEPMAKALEACHLLQDAGYELVCVTALQERYRDARQRNLEWLGFPVSKVIVTSSDAEGCSPKLAAMLQCGAEAFVDDYGPYLRGMPQSLHKALVLRERQGSPNVGEILALADSVHDDLMGFVQWWLAR